MEEKTYSQKKIEGWKLFSYNYTNGIVTPKQASEFVTINDGIKTTRLVFTNDKNCICTQANDARSAKRKIVEFIKKKSKDEKSKMRNLRRQQTENLPAKT